MLWICNIFLSHVSYCVTITQYCLRVLYCQLSMDKMQCSICHNQNQSLWRFLGCICPLLHHNVLWHSWQNIFIALSFWWTLNLVLMVNLKTLVEIYVIILLWLKIIRCEQPGTQNSCHRFNVFSIFAHWEIHLHYRLYQCISGSKVSFWLLLSMWPV